MVYSNYRNKRRALEQNALQMRSQISKWLVVKIYFTIQQSLHKNKTSKKFPYYYFIKYFKQKFRDVYSVVPLPPMISCNNILLLLERFIYTCTRCKSYFLTNLFLVYLNFLGFIPYAFNLSSDIDTLACLSFCFFLFFFFLFLLFAFLE